MSETKPNLADLKIDRSERRPKRGRGGLWLGLLIVILVAIAAFFFFRSRGVETVSVASARQERIGPGMARANSVLEASGYVTARRKATVSAKRTGKIVEVLVEEGMRVSEGQVLARLDDALLRRGLALAEAQVESARSQLAELEVRRAEAELNLGRTRQLVEAEVSTQSQLDADQAALDSLVARLEATRDEVTVAAQRVALDREQLLETVIRAPFDGVAISKDAQPGEMISPVSAGGGFTRTGICTLVDMSSLEIEVDVNETYIQRVQSDQPVEARLDAYPDWRIPAHVITIVPTADRQKATMKVRIGFDQLDPRILPDMGVKVAFLEDRPEPSADPGETRTAILVPEDAVVRRGDRDVAFVLRGDTVERRAVNLGARRGDEVEVLAGLTGSEQLVLSPSDALEDGAKVKVQ